MERQSAQIIKTVDQPGNIVKVAVQLLRGTEMLSKMLEMDQNQPLATIIKDMCDEWKLSNPEDYSLQFDEKKIHPPPFYITESNRNKIQSGSILKLDFSAEKTSQIIVEGLRKGDVTMTDLAKLSTLSCDSTFADHFITENGYHLLSAHIAKERGTSSMGRMGYALSAFVGLMEHNIVSWDTLDKAFLDSVNWCVNYDHSCSPDTLVMAIKAGLEILESVIRNSSRGSELIAELNLNTVDSFLQNLKIRDQGVQTMCIALVNAILEKSNDRSRRIISDQLHSKATRDMIWEHIFKAPIGIDTGYQLYALQTRLFNLLSVRLFGAINPKDGAAMQEVKELRKVAFDINPDLPHDSAMEKKDFAKLGFKTPSSPLEDLHEAPPGALALDCMAYFARQYQQPYVQMILENSRQRADEQDCPFARASIELTKLLAEHLAIEKPPADQDSEADCILYPMFFTKERAFEELFCICIQRFTKTWKEMKASLEDFAKVLMVVKEQISRALSGKLHTFDQLKTKLNQLSFSEIQSLRKKELEQKEEHRTRAKPIRELMEKIEPEIIDLVKQQRMNKMTGGCTFRNSKEKKKNERFILCRLAPNWKALHYSTCNSEQNVPESEPHIVSVLDIMDVVGEHSERNEKKKITLTLQEPHESLQLIANTEEDYTVWLDGFNALLGREMTSDTAKSDLTELLQMEIKLRLLDAEGINFPEEAPPLPPLPPNFNFATA